MSIVTTNFPEMTKTSLVPPDHKSSPKNKKAQKRNNKVSSQLVKENLSDFSATTSSPISKRNIQASSSSTKPLRPTKELLPTAVSQFEKTIESSSSTSKTSILTGLEEILPPWPNIDSEPEEQEAIAEALEAEFKAREAKPEEPEAIAEMLEDKVEAQEAKPEVPEAKVEAQQWHPLVFSERFNRKLAILREKGKETEANMLSRHREARNTFAGSKDRFEADQQRAAGYTSLHQRINQLFTTYKTLDHKDATDLCLELSGEFDLIKPHMEGYLERLKHKPIDTKKEDDITYSIKVESEGEEAAKAWLASSNLRCVRRKNLLKPLIEDWKCATKELENIRYWVKSNAYYLEGVNTKLTSVVASLDPVLNEETAISLQKDIDFLKKSMESLDAKKQIVEDYRVQQFKLDLAPESSVWKNMETEYFRYFETNILPKEKNIDKGSAPTADNESKPVAIKEIVDKGFYENAIEVDRLLRKLQDYENNLHDTIDLTKAAEWLHPIYKDIYDTRRREWRAKIKDIINQTTAKWAPLVTEMNFLGLCIDKRKKFSRYEATGVMAIKSLSFSWNVPALVSSAPTAIEEWDSIYKCYPPLHDKYKEPQVTIKAAEPLKVAEKADKPVETAVKTG